MKLVDTTFLIDVIRGSSYVKELMKDLDIEGIHAITAINVHEFLLGAHLASNASKELEVRSALLNKFVILNYDNNSAELAAMLESELQKKGELIGRADIMIAAVMKSNGLTDIVTRNTKHFEKIDGLNIISYPRM